MDCKNLEMLVVETKTGEPGDMELRELSDLQLAFVGGGIGETAV